MPKKVVSKNQKKILEPTHSFRLRHHRHTSYGSLAVVLLLACGPLLFASHAVAAAIPNGPLPPSEGQYKTYAVVPGAALTSAPTISNIRNGQSFSVNDPVTISGSCPTATLVKIFKNEVLAGAILCQNGTYQLTVDLFIGTNSLIARAYNTNDSVSPDSTAVGVQLQLPGSSLNGTGQLNNSGTPANQFYITSEISHRGANAGTTLSWPVVLVGGEPPYAVSVSWGDGKTDLYSRGDASRFDISHVYSKPAGDKGSYTIVVKATDQVGSKSFLQLAALVNSDKPAAGIVGSVTGGSAKSPVIKAAWQVMAVSLLVVLSFWLGERRELGQLKRAVVRTV